MGVPKIRGTLLGVPIIRIIVYLGLSWVPLFWEATRCAYISIQIRVPGVGGLESKDLGCHPPSKQGDHNSYFFVQVARAE